MTPGKGLFHCIDDFRIRCCLLFRLAHQDKYAGDMSPVGLLHLQALGIVPQVIVPVRQAEPALVEPGNHLGRVPGIRVSEIPVQRPGAFCQEDDRCVREILAGIDRVDHREIACERGDSRAVDGSGIHAGPVELPDEGEVPVGVPAGNIPGPEGEFEEIAVDLIPQFGKGSVVTFVGRDRMVSQPRVVDVRVEVVTRADRFVDDNCLCGFGVLCCTGWGCTSGQEDARY